MRTLSFGLIALSLAALVASCTDDTGPTRDLGNPNDLAMPTDMASDGGGSDQSIVDSFMPKDSVPLDLIVMPKNATQFAIDYATALCFNLRQCGRIPSDAASMAACIEANTAYPNEDLDSEIMLGRIELNEAQCLTAAMNARCDQSDFGYISDACATHRFIPKQAVGASCLEFFECISSYCAHTVTDAGLQGAGCPGKCSSYIADGQPCNSTDYQQECNPATSKCDSATHVCVKLPTSGQACTFTNFCPTGLYCAGQFYSATGQGSCTSPPAAPPLAGAPCDPNLGLVTPTPTCASTPGGSNLYCKVSYNASMQPTSGICAQKIALGASCDPNLETIFGVKSTQCVDGTVCAGATPTCQPYASQGQSCTATPCQQLLFCDTANGNVCRPLVADGAACSPSATTMCLAQNFAGDACLPEGADGGGICIAQKKYADSCIPGVDDSACSTGFCNASTSKCAVKCF